MQKPPSIYRNTLAQTLLSAFGGNGPAWRKPARDQLSPERVEQLKATAAQRRASKNARRAACIEFANRGQYQGHPIFRRTNNVAGIGSA